MHDTAMEIGALAIEIYCRGKEARILDLGSMDVNGSLRQVAPTGVEYVGVDIAEGPGVDIVVTPTDPLPLPDASFDLIVATSVLEHDPMFWMTFLEMCRKAKPGGFVYFNAPSNGLVHRYPDDNWRFYPDCGKALVRWASSQGLDVELVESFTAARKNDIWNDFTAVFRRLPAGDDLPNRAIHQTIACFNVITRDNPELLDPRAETEDMTLLSSARNDLIAKSDELAAVRSQLFRSQAEAIAVASSRDKAEEGLRISRSTVAELEAARSELTNDADRLRTALTDIETELAKTNHKLADSDAWVFELSQQRTALQSELRRAKQRTSRIEREMKAAKAQIAQFKLENSVTAKTLAAVQTEAKERETAWEMLGRTCHDLEQQLQALRQELDRTRDDLDLAQSRLQERNREIGTLSMRIVSAEKAAQERAQDLEWHKQVSALLTDPQPWWWAFLTAGMRQKRLERRLTRNGVFDSVAYLRRNPDVRNSGMSALGHYLRHGRAEGRSWH